MNDRLYSKDEVEDLIEAHGVLKDAECEKKIAEAVKAKVDWVVEWLDDIFQCELYSVKQRDELCRAMWQSLKKGE